jgi:hypothetical protein
VQRRLASRVLRGVVSSAGHQPPWPKVKFDKLISVAPNELPSREPSRSHRWPAKLSRLLVGTAKLSKVDLRMRLAHASKNQKNVVYQYRKVETTLCEARVVRKPLAPFCIF